MADINTLFAEMLELVMSLNTMDDYRWSYSFVEFVFPWMKYPTALLHMEWKNKKFYWEILYSNLWLKK